MSVISRIGSEERMDSNLNMKYALTIKEAAYYFNIGEKKIRRLAKDNTDSFSFMSGNRHLIIRTKLEEFLLKTESI